MMLLLQDTVMAMVPAVIQQQHAEISDAVLIQLMLSVVTLAGILAASIVQIMQMKHQNVKIDAQSRAVSQVHEVVNGTHSEALRRIELLSGEIRRLNISPLLTTPATSPVTIANESGIVETAPEVMVETELAPEKPEVVLDESGIVKEAPQ